MLTFALILSICALSANGQNQPKTLSKVSSEDGLTLGNGVSLDTVAPAYASPFSDIKVHREVIQNPQAELHTTVVVSSNALDKATGVNVQAKAHFLFASAESHLDLGNSSNVSDDSFRLVITGEAKYGDDQLSDASLKPAAAALISAGKMKEFATIYGTHFVLREHRIARISVIISVDRWSDTTLQSLRGSLGGSVSLGLAGGELKANIQTDLKEASRRGSLSAEVRTVGGTGLQGFGDIAKALIANSPDFQVSVGDAVAAMLKGFTRENAGIGSVTVSPYTEYGWDPNHLSLWNDLFEQKLQQCADLYFAGRDVAGNIRRSTIPNLAPELKSKLKGYATQYDDYLAHLAGFQKSLLDKDETFIAKTFPEEPEIDPDTAKALFTRFKTLEDKVDELQNRSELKYAFAVVTFQANRDPAPSNPEQVKVVRFPGRANQFDWNSPILKGQLNETSIDHQCKVDSRNGQPIAFGQSIVAIWLEPLRSYHTSVFDPNLDIHSVFVEKENGNQVKFMVGLENDHEGAFSFKVHVLYLDAPKK
jgi:hypothetical protein